MKSYFKYFIYVSFVFLAAALYEADYLIAPEIFSLPTFFFSFILICMSLLSGVAMWQQLLNKSNCPTSFLYCLAGTGLSIFSKYIPGKLWMIIGRAAYIAKQKSFPLSQLTLISLNLQLLTLWVGLIFGAIGLFLLEGLHIWGWLILLAWLVLTFAIFTTFGHSAAESIIKKMFKRSVSIPKLPIRTTFLLLPWFAVNWTLWSASFYMLVVSLSQVDVPLSVGLGFPLAVTLGIMALIAPGGLGAREGVMIGYLALAGFSLREATSISIVARLWFLVGEIIIFIIGIVADRYLNRKKVPL